MRRLSLNVIRNLYVLTKVLRHILGARRSLLPVLFVGLALY